MSEDGGEHEQDLTVEDIVDHEGNCAACGVHDRVDDSRFCGGCRDALVRADGGTVKVGSERSGQHMASCSRDCSEHWKADTIAALAKRVARHFNREHSRELRHNYQVFDRDEYGGDHIHGNVYQVRRIERRVTAYDIIAGGRNQPLDEAFATPEDPRCCTDCWRYTGTSEVDAVELDSADVWGCEWRCEFCHGGFQSDDRTDYERAAEECHQLGDYASKTSQEVTDD